MGTGASGTLFLIVVPVMRVCARSFVVHSCILHSYSFPFSTRLPCSPLPCATLLYCSRDCPHQCKTLDHFLFHSLCLPAYRPLQPTLRFHTQVLIMRLTTPTATESHILSTAQAKMHTETAVIKWGGFDGQVGKEGGDEDWREKWVSGTLLTCVAVATVRRRLCCAQIHSKLRLRVDYSPMSVGVCCCLMPLTERMDAPGAVASRWPTGDRGGAQHVRDIACGGAVVEMALSGCDFSNVHVRVCACLCVHVRACARGAFRRFDVCVLIFPAVLLLSS